MIRRIALIAIILALPLLSGALLPSPQAARKTEDPLASQLIRPVVGSVNFQDKAASLSDPVPTAEGPVRGEVNGDLVIFRGIPYAAPPAGDLRWHEPMPAEKRSDVLDAVTF